MEIAVLIMCVVLAGTAVGLFVAERWRQNRCRVRGGAHDSAWHWPAAVDAAAWPPERADVESEGVGWFDMTAFHLALNGVRRAKGLTWQDVAEKSGVNASTLTRIGQGKSPNLDNLAALAMWSGLSLDMFVTGDARPKPTPETAEKAQ